MWTSSAPSRSRAPRRRAGGPFGVDHDLDEAGRLADFDGLTVPPHLEPRGLDVASREAPASIAFSTNSLTAAAGRSTTSPAAMRLMRTGGRRRITIQKLMITAPLSDNCSCKR